MESRREWYDLHCHVLPGIDDGCKTPEESIELLKRDRVQGVVGVVATSHYYPKESVDHFLSRREEALQRLYERMSREPEGTLPMLCCGAEVAYHSGIAYNEDLEKLCFGKSRYLLLEMPFSAWPPNVLRDVVEIIGQGITPIIAHVERYLGYQDRETQNGLFGLDVLIQVNTGALEGTFKGRYARDLLKSGRVDVLSSDAHNLESRPPNLGIITKKYASRFSDEIERIRRTNRRVFQAAMTGRG